MFFFNLIFFMNWIFMMSDPFLILRNYTILCVFLVVAFLLSSLLIFLTYFLSSSLMHTNDELSEYECGFEPFDNITRQPFTIHFYIVGILFLLFDVEICLLFPWVLLLDSINWYGFWLVLFFLVILILGFLYEWKLGVISWI